MRPVGDSGHHHERSFGLLDAVALFTIGRMWTRWIAPSDTGITNSPPKEPNESQRGIQLLRKFLSVYRLVFAGFALVGVVMFLTGAGGAGCLLLATSIVIAEVTNRLRS